MFSKRPIDPSGETRRFFLGRIYKSPKQSNDPTFVKADDFTAEELASINVQGLGFKWEHYKDIDIGKLVTAVQARDGSTFVIGYVDSSSAIGGLMADAMKKGVLNGLSMAHDIKVFLNHSNQTLRYQKEPLEISLVDIADREGCQIFHNASTTEIQNSIPILTKELGAIESDRIFGQLSSSIQRFFQTTTPIMSSPATLPPVAAPLAAAAAPSAPAQQQVGEKRPLEASALDNAPNKVSKFENLDPQTKSLLEKLRPENTSKLNSEQLDQVLTVLGAEMSKMQEAQARLQKYEQERIAKEVTNVQKVRDGLYDVLKGNIKDPNELAAAGSQLENIFNRTIATGSPESIHAETQVFGGILAHTSNLQAQNQAHLKKIEELEQQLSRSAAEERVKQFGRDISGFSSGSSNNNNNSYSALPSYSSSSSSTSSMPLRLPPLPSATSAPAPVAAPAASAPAEFARPAPLPAADDMMSFVQGYMKNSANMSNSSSGGILAPPKEVMMRPTGGFTMQRK